MCRCAIDGDFCLRERKWSISKRIPRARFLSEELAVLSFDETNALYRCLAVDFRAMYSRCVNITFRDVFLTRRDDDTGRRSRDTLLATSRSYLSPFFFLFWSFCINPSLLVTEWLVIWLLLKSYHCENNGGNKWKCAFRLKCNFPKKKIDTVGSISHKKGNGFVGMISHVLSRDLPLNPSFPLKTAPHSNFNPPQKKWNPNQFQPHKKTKRARHTQLGPALRGHSSRSVWSEYHGARPAL